MEAEDLDKVSDLLFKRKYTELIVTEQLRLDQAIDYIKRTGIRKAVEWIKSNANLERGDRDVGLCFEDYLHFDYKDWQEQLKEWGL